MSPACILFPATAPVGELLPPDACMLDVLGPGPLIQVAAGHGCAVAWRAPHTHAEHNAHASRIAGQAVRGDACLLMEDACPMEVDSLLHGRPPKRSAQASSAAAAPTPQRGAAGTGSVGCAAAASVLVQARLETESSCKRQHLSGGEPCAGDAQRGAGPVNSLGGDGSGAGTGAGTPAAWADLPAHVVADVALRAGPLVAGVMALFGTCRPWRNSVLDDDRLLRALLFRIDAGAPLRRDHRLPPTALRAYLGAPGRHPRLLLRAAQLGNLSAVTVTARLLDAAGASSDALRHWRRAAKLGSVEGQLRAGLASYHGSCGVAQDAEAAAMWLGKALKQVQHQDAQRQRGREGAGRCGGPPSAAVSARQGDEDLATDGRDGNVSGAVRLRVLREAALVLGYLHFDGEGVAQDRAKSCALFKAAADAGSSEAAQVRGWMFNTGQYE